MSGARVRATLAAYAIGTSGTRESNSIGMRGVYYTGTATTNATLGRHAVLFIFAQVLSGAYPGPSVNGVFAGAHGITLPTPHRIGTTPESNCLTLFNVAGLGGDASLAQTDSQYRQRINGAANDRAVPSI